MIVNIISEPFEASNWFQQAQLLGERSNLVTTEQIPASGPR
jgi:hypothetical protein